MAKQLVAVQAVPHTTRDYLAGRLDGARDLYLLALALGTRGDQRQQSLGMHRPVWHGAELRSARLPAAGRRPLRHGRVRGVARCAAAARRALNEQT